MTNETKQKQESRNAAWYEQRGLTRITVVFSNAHKERLAQIAKRFDLSQNAVIEVFLDEGADETFSDQLLAKATVAVGKGRPAKNPTKSSVNKLLKNMTPEQLAAAQKMLAGLQTSA